ncbi:auxilin-like clathrin-binding protein required for normal clathrin function [Vanrija albida]|uniref:Auxilin-like clathrin-binding protein required for normal clathrin function n=1 Tax=Vanrija albida TaxID=181172 RepID=A0ABR3PXL0_9TREE
MDDLLDLNWSSSSPATSSTAGNGSKSSGTAPGSGRNSAASSSFDLLSKPAGAGPSYFHSSGTTPRSTTPLAPVPSQAGSRLNGLGAPLNPSSRTATPSAPASRTSPAPPAPKSSGADAFSALLGGSGPSGTGPGAKSMTMAERQAQLAAEKAAKEEHERLQFAGDAGFWDKFGDEPSSSKSPTVVAPTPAPALKAAVLQPTSAPTSRPSSSAPPVKSTAGSLWDNDDFFSSDTVASSKASAPSPPAPSAAPADPWDFDALSATVPAQSSTKQSHNKEDYSYGDGEDEDDDLLGELGRPVRRRSPKPEREPPARASAPGRSSSPPPHIIGQIVEMGFSPAQARAALAATATGEDVQAAIESLLPASGRASRGDQRPRSRGPEDFEADDERVAREMQLREEQRRARHAARRAGPSREAPRQQLDQDDEGGDQVDRIMAQATEVGSSMLSAATSFWNRSKEQALKVYEEQRRNLDAQQAAKRGNKPPTDGRPRWMVEAEEGGSHERNDRAHTAPRRQERENGGFRDDSDDEVLPPRPQQQRQAQRAPAQAPAPAPKHDLSVKERADLLFADEPKRYVSKNRHPKGRGAPAAAPAPAVATPQRPATPLRTREIVPASASQTSAAATHKAKGNEHFKLGRFSEAEAAYSSAISSLPTGHLLLVPLYNNRAAARLKLGEASSSASDSTTVIELVGVSYHPSRETPLPSTLAEVKLGDALVKATTKRAQAWEMAEKWRQALEDWERVLGFDVALVGGNGAASKSQASEGIKRSKAMLSGEANGNGAPAPSRPKVAAKPAAPRPSRPVDVAKSSAVSELRKAAETAAREDDQRDALKDSVDAKLEAWRKGKETNLRGLIASLDTVLWDDILKGGLKVGMHELVTDKQVKIKYMKVVARLHPDKLAATSATVEQRMLAGGAFGTLAEAWAAFNA